MRWFLLIAFLVLPCAVHGAEQLTFEKHVRPILKAHCFLCHGEEDKPKAKLDLRLPSLIAKGGASGSALTAGKSHESLLWERIENDEMPEGPKKLNPAQKQIIKTWIEQGAKTARPEPKDPNDLRISEEERGFWAFQPIQKPGIPKIEGVSSPIDALVRAKFAQKGLTPSAKADKRTLIRRAYFDLIGLPPTPEQVAAFLNDSSPDAFSRVLDELLASPQYGERWGRHWLDVAGYADSDGANDADKIRPHLWKYRDYVVRSFNNDKPYDRFLKEQLAGDELVTSSLAKLTPEDLDNYTATAFLRLAPDGTDTSNTLETRNDAISESLKVVSSAFLGLTIGCAQCHDHRYDPISQPDYYRFRAIFEPAWDLEKWRTPSMRYLNVTPKEVEEERNRIEVEAAKQDAVITAKYNAELERVFERELLKVPEEERATFRIARNTPDAKTTPEQKVLLRKYPNANVKRSLDLYDPKAFKVIQEERAVVAKLRSTKPETQLLAAMTEQTDRLPETKLFSRGNPDAPRQVTPPGELPILALNRTTGNIPPKAPQRTTSGRRLAYAEMLTDGKHPLTARVIVNRMWMHHFGKGLVATPGDFGLAGDRPGNPELLDHLATTFMESGWKIKQFHKMIMLTETWQQTSVRNPANDRIDPDNRFLSRQNLRRLEAETIRDAILAVNGKLMKTVGGTPIPVVENTEGIAILGKQKILNGLLQGTDPAGEEANRRSLYIQSRRKVPLGMLEVFDLPVMTPNCDARRFTTVPQQSLHFLNSEFIIKQADLLGERLQKEPNLDLVGRINRAYELLYNRPATEIEKKLSLDFVTSHAAVLKQRGIELKNDALAKRATENALVSLCQALMSSSGFLYID